jgi:chaperone required for assembly of F1-ATPase
MKLRRRLYELATVTGEGPFGIELDGRPLKTPYEHPLILESRPLAEAIAAEWQAQDSLVVLPLMKFTSLAFRAIDHIADAKERTIGEIALFAGSDLVCYRATEPPGLVERQAAHWDPILDMVREMLGMEFMTVQGVTYKEQPAEALRAISGHLESKSPCQLSAIRHVTVHTGSVLIALTLAEGRLTADAAWAAAHADEDWQIEQWGQDPEAKKGRDAYARRFYDAVEFLRLASAH